MKNKLYNTPIKAIRKHCLDCCCGSHKEVRECTVIKCAIYPYRLGFRPNVDTIRRLEDYFGKKD